MAPGVLEPKTMADEMLRVAASLPLGWERRDFTAAEPDALWHGSLLTLRVANLMESAPGREGESERGPERMEAKLDLALYLLAKALQAQHPPPEPAALTLMAEGIRFHASAPPPVDAELLLHLYPSAGLPLPVQLPVRVAAVDAGQVSVHWLSMPEAAREAWEQWLFRQHRRAVQAIREAQEPPERQP
jgi:Atypical PilZ domain, cyclic di-GMP receptor